MGSAARILDFQNVLSCASSGVIRSVCISLRTPSIHLPLGLPLGVFPGTLMSLTALTSFSSILCMCPCREWKKYNICITSHYWSNMACLMVLIMNLHISKCPTFYISLILANFRPYKVNVDWKLFFLSNFYQA